MSWAEVKKINDNLDEPLNALINRLKPKKRIYVNKATSANVANTPLSCVITASSCTVTAKLDASGYVSLTLSKNATGILTRAGEPYMSNSNTSDMYNLQMLYFNGSSSATMERHENSGAVSAMSYWSADGRMRATGTLQTEDAELDIIIQLHSSSGASFQAAMIMQVTETVQA